MLCFATDVKTAAAAAVTAASPFTTADATGLNWDRPFFNLLKNPPDFHPHPLHRHQHHPWTYPDGPSPF